MREISLWTKEEIDVLRDSHNRMTIIEIRNLLINRTEYAISTKMSELRLKPIQKQNRWNEQDINVLLKCSSMKVKDVQLLFPDRSIGNIRGKARELKINLLVGDEWTTEEDSILIENANGKLTPQEVSNLLSNRTLSAVNGRIRKLNLKYSDVSRRGITKTVNFKAKTSIVFKYKAEYGIELDFNQGIHTYDSVQWWRWTYHETPNGKSLHSLPKQFYNKEDELLKIIRHVLCNEFKYEIREDFLSLSIASFKKYRIHFKSLFLNGICNVLNKAFPEYKFKPFEFNNVPLGYWKNKDNCDDYMKHIIEEKIIAINLLDVKSEIPKIFNFAELRDLRYSGLTYSISVHRHYESFYEWLNCLYPEWNLTAEDFKESYGFDGVRLNSREESLVYNVLKEDLGLDVISTGIGKSFKFYDEVNSETYVPDFLITYKDKKFIVEYFGLFRKNYGNSKILQKYYYKTQHKINYFSNLINYNFIYIFPEELQDTEKLKRKIIQSVKGGE